MIETVRADTSAPPFEAKDQTGALHRLSDYGGRWVVLFFYPKDRTVHCTIEACSFRDLGKDFRQEDAQVFGVSRDDVESHEDFARRRSLSYPLLSDVKGDMMRAYGAEGWFGRARRVTFIIDPDGRVAKVYARVRGHSHPRTVLSDLKALKAKRGVYVPSKTRPAVVTA